MNKSFMRYKNIFIVMLSILLVFSFFIFFQTDTSPKVHAQDPDIVSGQTGTGGHSSVPNDSDMSFHVSSELKFYFGSNGGETGLSVGFFVPYDIMNYYFQGQTHTDVSIFEDYSSMYYFRLIRFSDVSYFSNSSLGYDFERYYSYGQSLSNFSSFSLLSYRRLNDGRYYCKVFLPLPAEDCYNVDYYYCIDFCQYIFDHYSITAVFDNCESLLPPELNILYRSSNCIHKSVSSLATETLNSGSLTSDQTRLLQHFAGINVNSGTYPVVLRYKRCTGFNQVEDVSASYAVNSLYAGNGTLSYSSVLGSFGATDDGACFNCVFRNVKNNSVDGVDLPYLLDQRTILSVDFNNLYTYTFDSSNNTGYIDINYRPFQYKDFAIEVKDNDDSDGFDLTFYVCPVDVEILNGNITLTYNYSDIENMVLNSCGWLFELSQQNFTDLGSNAYVSVNVGEDVLTVSFSKSNEEKLLGVRISCLADIIPDREVTVTLQYASLDNNLEETTLSETADVYYSEYVRLGFNDYFYSKVGSYVDSYIHPSCLNGLDYYEFSNVTCVKTGEDTYRIVVGYSYNTLFKLTNSLNSNVVYQGLTKNSLSYYGVDLDYTIPSGWRISNLSTTDSHSVTITNNEEYFNETRVVVNCSTHDKKIIPLHATMVDTWHVDFMYLDQYNDSCFAVKRIERKDLRIADYGNIRELSLSDVASILNRDSMNVLKSRADETLKVEFNGKSTYTVTLTYSYTTIRMSEASGQYGELKVPLSCYADWCNGIGQNWSILYLNNPENNYFRYSNEVPREYLYGYFASVVFTEQLRDINTWFAQESGDGAVVLSVSKEIRGSDFYKFIRNNTLTFAAAGAFIGGAVGVSGGPVGVVGGSVAGGFLGTGLNLGIAMLCETFDDQNATYYNYFTYIDCKSEQAFLSRSGATDAYDHDNAVKNTAQKVESDLTDFFSGLKTDTDNFIKLAGIVLGAVGALLVLSLIIRILSPAISKIRERKRDKKNE